MTALRQKMIEDMQLRGFAERTQEAYLSAVRKLLYLATMNITKKWTAPIQNWPLILNQLAIRFEDRLPL